MKNRKNKSHDPESQTHDTITHSTYVYYILNRIKNATLDLSNLSQLILHADFY